MSALEQAHTLEPLSFAEIKGWQHDDHRAAFLAFCNSAKRMIKQPYKTKAFGVSGAELARIGQNALDLVQQGNLTVEQSRHFFESHFNAVKISGGVQTEGFVTGFFEPEVTTSRVHQGEYQYPIYVRPPDLIDIDEHNRPETINPSVRYGRNSDQAVEMYLDRRAIQEGALEGQGLELVWLKDKVDLFFIHVQGSARLVLQDGSIMRITYTAKSGHAYTSVAKVLCAQLAIEPSTMTADRLADWLRGHPDQIDQLLAHNQSYIFFEEVTGQSPEQGPVAAAKTPLIEGRSLAVDRLIHTFGTPIWVSVEQPIQGYDAPFERLMIAQDTGSAIVGACRGDIFAGTGKDAGLIAGRIRHAADMIVLMPKRPTI